MPSFLIHVGPHKTGTTYLQLRLAAARERLRAVGVAYPEIWDSAPGEPSHRKLAVGLREANIAELRAQFAAIRRDDPEYVLISAEGIDHLDQPAIELLASLTNGNPVTIIFYVRRWSELLPSRWQETIKHGDDETFPEFFALHMADPINSPVLNYTHSLDRYARVFGRSRLAVISYSDLGDRGIDLAEHFLASFLPRHQHILGNLPPLTDPRPNRSLPIEDVEIIRALNSFSMRDGLPRSSRLREWFVAHRDRFDLTVLQCAMDASLGTLRVSDASVAVDALHKNIWTTYQDRLIPPFFVESFFAPRTADIRFVRPRYLADADAHGRLAEIYAAFCAA